VSEKPSQIQRVGLLLTWLAFSQAILGQEIFTQTFDVGNYLAAPGVAVDSTSIYVCVTGLETGQWDYLLSRRSSAGAFLTKFSRDGALIWTRTVDAAETSSCLVSAADGRIFLLKNRSQYLGDVGLYAFASDGAELWNIEVPWAKSVSADAAGVYVGGNDDDGGFVHRHNLGGERVWSHSVTDHTVESLAADAGGVYSGGLILDGNIGGGVIQRQSGDGAELWTRKFQDGEPVSHLAADGSAVYAVRGSHGPSFLEKLDAAGNVLWSRPNGALEGVAVKGIVADSSGLYLVGHASAPLPGSCHGESEASFVLKFDAEGSFSWGRHFASPELVGSFNSVAVGPSGIYVAGQLGTALLGHIDVADVEIADSGPWIHAGCVVNAANYRSGPIAPREIVSIFGRRIGPSEAATIDSMNGEYPTVAANAQVLFNGVAARLLYVSQEQINAIAPDSISNEDSVSVQVEYAGVRSNAVRMPVGVAAPGIFSARGTGRGPLLALNSDGTWNSPTNQAELGSQVTLFATGLGLAAGAQASFCCYSDQATPVGELELYGLSLPGLLQVRIRIPERLAIDAQWGSPAGEAPLALDVGGATSGYEGFIYVRNVYQNCLTHPNSSC
jgi:uncharacterized protein (TIGR03437 family)